MRHLIIITTYNECENIAAIIKAVLDIGSTEILVVDDGSPDGTGQIVNQLQQEDERIHLIQRSGKLGLGTAYIAGFRYGLEKGFDYINEMDADFSHSPSDLSHLRKACENGAGAAVGSRYVKGGGTENWSWLRRFISQGGSFYVRALLSLPVKDPTAGFICYRADVLRQIDLDKVEFTGYGFQIEMKYIVHKLGYGIKEIPIIFKERELGVSKMNISIIFEAINGVLKLRRRNVRKFYKKAAV